jgi:hypothetical protein
VLEWRLHIVTCLESIVFGDDVPADVNAFVANKNSLTRDQFPDLRFLAERASQFCPPRTVGHRFDFTVGDAW